mmetsp:Transcript_126304/g.178253  ORF Transcript_126304/g.178253 Transcript_126304/m.178253 type:complete len:151 (+) Transcript_126304:40-492(+)
MKLRRSSWLARAAVLLVAAASWVFGSSFLFIGPPASQSLPTVTQRGQSDRGSLVSRHAREVDEEEVLFNFRKPSKKKGFDPNWKRPFPKYIVMGGVMMTFVGYLGGGPILSAVWGLCGAGFGCLFEPWQTADGTISGLYDEDDEDEDDDD